MQISWSCVYVNIHKTPKVDLQNQTSSVAIRNMAILPYGYMAWDKADKGVYQESNEYVAFWSRDFIDSLSGEKWEHKRSDGIFSFV